MPLLDEPAIRTFRTLHPAPRTPPPNPPLRTFPRHCGNPVNPSPPKPKYCFSANPSRITGV